MNEMRFGLSTQDISFLKSVFSKVSEVEKVLVFGSRALGTHRPGSDVDLALFGTRLTHEIVTRLSAELNQLSPLPYRFDLTWFENLANQALLEHIQDHGKILYSRSADG